VSQADLWADGRIIVRQPWATAMTWRGADASLAPLGYRPLRPAPHGTDIVPIYSPGVPILMAAFKIAAGPRAVYYVVPLLGGLAVWFTFLLGRRLSGPFAGAAGAGLFATSPTLLFEVTAPASDVAATAWWTLALLALTYDSRRATLGAGVATGMAILTRPNVAPLAVLLVLPLVWRVLMGPSGADRRAAAFRVFAYAAGAAPACAGIGVLNWQLYGSPLSSGYGSLDSLYAWSHLWPNLERYPRWLTETQTPLVWLAFAVPWLLPVRGTVATTARPRAMGVLWLGAALTLFGLYAFYEPFEDWWYLRFLMPLLPALLVLVAVGLFGATRLMFGRVSPAGWRLAAVIPVGLLAVHGILLAGDRGAAQVWDAEQRYRVAGQYVASNLPERAAVLSVLHSGSIRHYSGRITVRYDRIRPGHLDQVLGELRRLGYHPYFVIDAAEEANFRGRFTEGSPLGLLDWAPRAVLHQGLVRVYDPADRPACRISSAGPC
jgi:hypothetical protein